MCCVKINLIFKIRNPTVHDPALIILVSVRVRHMQVGYWITGGADWFSMYIISHWNFSKMTQQTIASNPFLLPLDSDCFFL